MKTALWVALGSGLGGVARVLSGLAVLRILGGGLPYGTLFVNVAGSFAIGWIAVSTAPGGRIPLSSDHRQFLMTGICGGFTTYSIFILGTLEFMQAGKMIDAFLYVLATLCICMIAVWGGHAVGQAGLSRGNRGKDREVSGTPER